jgi:hypothetical protein
MHRTPLMGDGATRPRLFAYPPQMAFLCHGTKPPCRNAGNSKGTGLAAGPLYI